MVTVDIIEAHQNGGSTLAVPLRQHARGSLLPKQLVVDTPFSAGFTQNYDKQYWRVARRLRLPARATSRRCECSKPTVAKFHDDLRRLELTTLHRTPNAYGLTLILGGAEVTCGAHRAYRTLALAAQKRRFDPSGGLAGRRQHDPPIDPGAAWAIGRWLRCTGRERAPTGDTFKGRVVGWKTAQ